MRTILSLGKITIINFYKLPPLNHRLKSTNEHSYFKKQSHNGNKTAAHKNHTHFDLGVFQYCYFLYAVCGVNK